MSENNFAKFSYKNHESHFKDYTKGAKKEERAETWFNTNTVDSWRHKRMYTLIDPLLAYYPEAKWLTVGDGRYGKDAHYIQQKGISALPTDISDFLLKEAKEMGYITDFRKENAEALSFPDETFDFVFCKESYHHFPRPMVALHEMIRVARKGVVLIEPNDSQIINFTEIKLSTSILVFWRFFKNFIKSFLKKTIHHHFGGYELDGGGNYIYTISEREIEKVALGLNLKMVAFKGLNDCYAEGVEYEKLAKKSGLYNKVKTEIKKADKDCKLGVRSFDLLAAIIFKKIPSSECIEALKNINFKAITLPKNPAQKTKN